MKTVMDRREDQVGAKPQDQTCTTLPDDRRGQPAAGIGGRWNRKKTIWIDIDNSPHVPFFLPIIEELQKHDAELLLTARNMYQVCELLDYFHLPCKVIGGHYGKNKLLKVICNCLRAAELVPLVIKHKPDLAISHGSRAQVLVSKVLGIPTLVIHDYEHSTKTGFIEPDWILMPDVIPDGAMSKRTERVLKYHGLKEDVYVPRFRPNPSILEQLGLSASNLIVTLRPPATEAHYHNPESDVLFAETVRFLAEQPGVRTVALPRNGRQKEQLRSAWSDLIASGRLIIPGGPINGLNLIWFSDLVISGGGTMNREAAALGVPVYSIFRGKLGAVDKYLAQQGRLTLIESVSDVRSKIALVHWQRPEAPGAHSDAVLQKIVDSVLMIVGIEDSHRMAG
jgi:predicted glycosyltransferase